jgi:hypothetical protein
MAQNWIASFKIVSTLGQFLTVSDGRNQMPRTDLWTAADSAQEFMWYPDFTCFATIGHVGDYHVEIWKGDTGDTVEVDSDTMRAILVPFTVSEVRFVWVTGDGLGFVLPIHPGCYQLIFQNRYLTDEEIRELPDFDQDDQEYYDDDELKPELCKLTFIPATGEVEPQILRQDSEMTPPSVLVMHDYTEDIPPI